MQLAFFLIFISQFVQIQAGCSNACSGHGTCGSYDMCKCYRNWMGSDCSQRVCQFNTAHVDISLGDLDASGTITGPSHTVIKNNQIYPWGTQEQFPNVVDSNGVVITETGHSYTECSSKGTCDRSSGTCVCFTGYSGSACQRADCPISAGGKTCSGHGVCKSARAIANDDHNNTYFLWDQDATQGCQCDGGYFGPDCSMRKCKYGIDPLYLDNGRSANVANFTIEMWTLAPAATTAAQAYNAVASSNVYIEGNFSIVHTDTFGETWQTTPLDIHSTCADIISALEALPNDVFNGGVTCYRSTFTRGYLKQTSGTWMTINGQEPPINGGGVTQNPIVDNGRYVYEKWTLVFNNNPGYTNSLSINKYLDGDRPTRDRKSVV